MLKWKTNLKPAMWLPDLDVLEIETDASMVEISIAVSTSAGGPPVKVILSGEYTGASGRVTLYDIGRLVRPYLIAVTHCVCVRLTVTAGNNDPLNSILTAVGLNGLAPGDCSEYLESRFTTSVDEKLTAPGRTEYASFTLLPGSAGGRLTVTDDYLSAVGSLSRRSRTLRTYPPNTGAFDVYTYTEDVSPDQFADPSAGVLLGYTVSMGRRLLRFNIPERPLPATVEFRFVNRFGFVETAGFTGPKTDTYDVERRFVTIGGRRKSYSREETFSSASATGFWPDSMIPLATALAVSDSVTAIENGIETEVDVTDSDIKPDDSGLNSVSVTWRPVRSGAPIVPASARSRSFDPTFDNTFN